MAGKSIIIMAGGGHAKVLVNALLLSGVKIAGIIDMDRSKTEILGISILGDEAQLEVNFHPSKTLLINGLGSTQNMSRRKQLYERFKSKGYTFNKVIHPSAVVAPDVVTGEGVQIMAGVVIQPGVSIGEDSIINTSASVDHDCRIGKHVHVAPGVTLSGNVNVGDEVHIGTGATIIHGITLGDGCLVAAGATVVENVLPGTSVFGTPAKVKK